MSLTRHAPLSLRLALRDLRGALHSFGIFLACLTLGVAAIAAIGTVRAGIEAGLTREGAALLGGDAEMEFTYRHADPAERRWMRDTALAVSEVVDFRSMAVVGDARALTQVKAVDAAYPLVGQVRLDPPQPLARALAGRAGLPGAVMAQALIDRLELSEGDRFRLGGQDFVLMGALVSEPDDAGAGFGLGPRTLVATPALAQSGLLAPGTLFSTRYRLQLPDGAGLEDTAREARARFETKGMRWRDARNGAPGVAEFVARLGAFLVLVGLSGLAVGGVGVASAVSGYLAGKSHTIATLRTLGASRGTIWRIYAIQIGLVSLLGIALGMALGGAAPVALGPLIAARLPVPAEFTLFARPLLEAGLYGLLIAGLFTLWPLTRATAVRAATLYRDTPARVGRRATLGAGLALGGGLALLLGAATLFSGNAWLTLWTAGGIAAALGVLALAALVLRLVARRGGALVRGRAALRWALAAIAGRGEASGPVVLSLGLGLSVLAAVGQIDGNLRQAISGDLPDIAPSYFFVDIQRDQIGPFSAQLTDNPAVSRLQSAPMLRGVITRINDRPAREVAGDHWVLQGDRGVTYSGPLPEGTRVTAGRWWAEDYAGPPQISFASEEAEEMGLALGDRLTVNILGRDITAEITSFRDVDFSTAGIGFVMAMNPAALAGAPHSFIATVYAAPEAEAAILREMAGAFPNITAIRVRDAIERVAGVLNGLAAATSWGAAASLLTGFLVLIGAAATGRRARIYEAAVLKTLGASRAQILRSLIWRSALMGGTAGLVALMAGIAGGWAVCHFVLETDFIVIWRSALAIVSGGVALAMLAGIAFVWQPLAARPAQVLRDPE